MIGSLLLFGGRPVSSEYFEADDADDCLGPFNVEVKPNLPYYIWRVARTLYLWHVPVIPFLLQQVSRIAFCCLVPYKTQMGRNVHLNHLGMGIIINPESVIGNNVKINQHVTIGGSGEGGCPIIEDEVYIGAGAKVLGGIRIGRGAKIGANAVVLCDVPAGTTAVGVPARVIERKNKVTVASDQPGDRVLG